MSIGSWREAVHSVPDEDAREHWGEQLQSDYVATGSLDLRD
jgi:hypothetical protein